MTSLDPEDPRREDGQRADERGREGTHLRRALQNGIGERHARDEERDGEPEARDEARDEQVAKIHAPIGLDTRARNPEEIALSILGEMVAAKNGVQTLGRHSGGRVATPA